MKNTFFKVDNIKVIDPPVNGLFKCECGRKDFIIFHGSDTVESIETKITIAKCLGCLNNYLVNESRQNVEENSNSAEETQPGGETNTSSPKFSYDELVSKLENKHGARKWVVEKWYVVRKVYDIMVENIGR